MNVSTIQTTDNSSSSNNDIVDMMDSFTIKRKRTIKWGNDVVDTETNGITDINDIYHTRKKTPKKTNNNFSEGRHKKILFKVIHTENCN